MLTLNIWIKNRAFRGGFGKGVKNFFPHPNDLLIWAYPENLVKIGLLVEAVESFCRTGQAWEGMAWAQCDYIDNLSLGFGFG